MLDASSIAIGPRQSVEVRTDFVRQIVSLPLAHKVDDVLLGQKEQHRVLYEEIGLSRTEKRPVNHMLLDGDQTGLPTKIRFRIVNEYDIGLVRADLSLKPDERVMHGVSDHGGINEFDLNSRVVPLYHAGNEVRPRRLVTAHFSTERCGGA
jgi:hypothetical protein